MLINWHRHSLNVPQVQTFGTASGINSLSDNRRIKKVREEIDELERRMKRVTTDDGKLVISQAHVASAVVHLRQTLEAGTVTQQKRFIRSFVRKIVYDFPKVTIYYTFPIDPQSSPSGGEHAGEVLSLTMGSRVLGVDRKGSSGRTRTYNPPVNRLMQVIYPVGSSCFSVGLDSWFSAYSAKNCSVIVRSSAQFDLGTRGRVPFRRPDFADFQ